MSRLPAKRPFRFGAHAPRSRSFREWLERVRVAEALGYDVVYMNDHFGIGSGPFTALGAAAAATNRIRLSTLVLGNDYRHPAIVAKEFATLDVISGGRVEVGIGAGWMVSDYEGVGIELDPASIRIDRLEESVKVLRGLFADGPFSFEGRHYRLSRLEGRPKPVQRPAPPIFIGGGGRRVLSVAARHADIVGLHVELSGSVALARAGLGAGATATLKKIGWLREAAGERFDGLELNVLVFVVGVDRSFADVAAECEARFAIPAGVVPGSPHVLAGSVDEMVDQIIARRELYGLSYLTVMEPDVERFAPVIARLAGQ